MSVSKSGPNCSLAEDHASPISAEEDSFWSTSDSYCCTVVMMAAEISLAEESGDVVSLSKSRSDDSELVIWLKSGRLNSGRLIADDASVVVGVAETWAAAAALDEATDEVAGDTLLAALPRNDPS